MMTKVFPNLVALLNLCLLLPVSIFAQAQPVKKFVEGKPFLFTPRETVANAPGCGQQQRFRTLDGTCNNIGPGRTEWGATEIILFRDIPAQYGSTDPNNAMGGQNRPSARQVSNALSDEPVETLSKFKLSTFTYIWGQFLDHDISLTPTGTEEYVPIKLPANEPLFTNDIPFYRSEVHAGTGQGNPRQQSNYMTAWVDGSQVYGTDETRANWLRTFRDGKLKTSAGNLLPFNTLNGEYTGTLDVNAPSMAGDNNHTTKTFVAGDVRAAEHPGLTSLHTLFVREHNRICDRLKNEGLRNDEEMYQRARKEVGALLQAITYQEFLPALGVIAAPYRGYNPNARPDLTNIFSTAAYRLGHSMVADNILLRDNQCQEVGPGELSLLDIFFNTLTLRQYNIDPVLKGLSVHTQYETDLKVNSVLRNMLFGDPNAAVRFGLDLVSLNIQRGRDHGLPDYNTVRRFYTGQGARNFKDITNVDSVATALQNLYGNVNNVDLWAGLLAEDDLPGKSFGRTLHEILRTQFEKMRDGDFYYFLNDPNLPRRDRDRIGTTRLSDVIRRNSTVDNLQTNVFYAVDCPATIAPRADITAAPARADLSVFPNPASDRLTVKSSIPTDPNSLLEIFTVQGKLIRSIRSVQDSQELDIQDLKPGLYIISLTGTDKTVSVRFIKH